MLGEFLLGFISAKGLYPICETFFHKTLLSVLTQTPKTVYKRAVEPKQTAFSLLDLGAVGKQKEKEMKDEGGMVKGGGQSAVGSGQSAEEAREARERLCADGIAGEGGGDDE